MLKIKLTERITNEGGTLLEEEEAGLLVTF
jgi:hypothetical protein